MSLDRRLREELRQLADSIEPDVERRLGAVEARARRRGGIGPSGVLIAAAIIVAALILRVPDHVTTPGSGPGSSAQPTLGASAAGSPSTPPSYPQIAGVYLAALDPANATVKKDGVGGAWTMRLDANGAVVLSPPATFLPGVKSGIAFSLAGDHFRTDLFYNDYCNSVGNYVWHLVDRRLTFTSVDDTCSIRRTLLTTAPWLTSQ
jgi:hypothetical protein